MKQKAKIYLDTSFINYLVAMRQPEKMKDTLALWDVFATEERFDIVLSEIVDEELQSCYEPKRTQLLDKLSEISFELV